jgi:hypothetical protein
MNRLSSEGHIDNVRKATRGVANLILCGVVQHLLTLPMYSRAKLLNVRVCIQISLVVRKICIHLSIRILCQKRTRDFKYTMLYFDYAVMPDVRNGHVAPYAASANKYVRNTCHHLSDARNDIVGFK